MENKESGNLNSNGTDHKLEVDEVIAAEAATTEEFNEMIAKASESVAETASESNLGHEEPTEDDLESIDEGGKIMQAEQNMEAAGDFIVPENETELPSNDESEISETVTDIESIDEGEKIMQSEQNNVDAAQDFTATENETEIAASDESEISETTSNVESTDDASKIVQEVQNIETAHDIIAAENGTESNETETKPESSENSETTTDEEAHHELILQQIEAHTEEIADPLENYESMGKEMLIEKLSALLEQDDVAVNKNKAFAIRDAFAKIITQERSEALAKLIEEGGTKEDFEKTKDEKEEQFNQLFDRYKKKRNEQIDAAEKQKVTNYAAKQEVLNQLKNLIQNEENMQKAYSEFNELQNRWRAIGAVPANHVRDLLLNYKLYVDRFYDFVKINRELQALDQKKNLLLKINLCERAEQLMLESSINKAIGQINNLMYEWRETGPIARDKKDELWQRFKAAVDKVFERRREHEESLKGQHGENLELKKQLIARLEPFANVVYDKHSQWQEALKEVMQITTEYKKIGHAARKENEEAWTRFKTLGDSFFKNKNDYYQSRKKENSTNVQLKTELCIQAEGLKESTDWKATSQELIRLQDEWKKIGHIFDKQNQKLWTRFKTACDDFFTRKSTHFSSVDKEYDENYEKKIALIEQIEKFEMGEDNQNNLDQMRDFQRQWTEIGLVPLKKKDEVQKRYRAAIDRLYDNLKMDEREKSKVRFTQRTENVRSYSGDSRGGGSHKGGAGKGESVIANKIHELSNEVTIWKNNIGFFSKSKNADVIRKEFEEKINNAQSEITALKQKLKELKETE
ncbi:MAG: DUF349 domain-containing protein [Bacteroidia bacterium]